MSCSNLDAGGDYVASVKHGRVFITQDAPDGLTRRLWCFRRRVLESDSLLTQVALTAFFTQTRPSRRHTFRGVATECWALHPEAEQRERQLATPPLPTAVVFLVLATVRQLVTLAAVGEATNE